MIIKDKMSIYCRTEEELQVFLDVATKEGWKLCDGTSFSMREYGTPIRFNAGVYGEKYPAAFTYGKSLAQPVTPYAIIIEASDFFRNQLIARRVNHDKGTISR